MFRCIGSNQARRPALLHFATVCSSWVIINRGTSQRSDGEPLGPNGGESARHYVRAANVMVARVSLLMIFALCLGHDVILEQPSSSLMFKHPRVCSKRCGGRVCLTWAAGRKPFCRWVLCIAFMFLYLSLCCITLRFRLSASAALVKQLPDSSDPGPKAQPPVYECGKLNTQVRQTTVAHARCYSWLNLPPLVL